MMKKQLINTKIKIEKLEKKLSAENCWISDYTFWKEVWGSVLIKDISSRRTLYLFAVNWKREFPTSFRVKINDRIFIPTQAPVIDPASDMVIFHATADENSFSKKTL